MGTLSPQDAERMLAAAVRYGVAPSEWAAMNRAQRKAAKRRAQGKPPMGAHQWSTPPKEGRRD
jgi:hypothetical protein